MHLLRSYATRSENKYFYFQGKLYFPIGTIIKNKLNEKNTIDKNRLKLYYKYDDIFEKNILFSNM